MSMMPFFPSLRPPIWFGNVVSPINEEAEVLRYEREHHQWLDNIKSAGKDLNPLGKVLTIPGPETDDEDANDDDSDDSEDEEDDDTNDRAIPGPPERALELYPPSDEEVNEDAAGASNE